MNKMEKIRQIYAIVTGILVFVTGVAFICVTADIYYSGKSGGDIYTVEKVVSRLRMLSVPFFVSVGVIAIGAIFPLYEAKVKNSLENIEILLQSKIPAESGGEEYDAAAANYKKLGNIRLGMWIGEGVILLGCVIAALCYMLNAANFPQIDVTSEIFNMFQHVFPWVAAAFVTLIAASAANGVIAKKRLRQIRTLIKFGVGSAAEEPAQTSLGKMLAATEKALSNNIALWVARGIVFVVGVTFVILGIVNGGANDVLVKAINICTECIGLG